MGPQDHSSQDHSPETQARQACGLPSQDCGSPSQASSSPSSSSSWTSPRSRQETRITSHFHLQNFHLSRRGYSEHSEKTYSTHHYSSSPFHHQVDDQGDRPDQTNNDQGDQADRTHHH